MGGDGIINVRFQQTQYMVATRILFSILFFIPLPSEANVMGEVVKFEPSAPAPGQGASPVAPAR